MIEDLLEERGWEAALYPGGGHRFYAFGKEGLGLFVRPDKDDRFWTVYAGDAIAGSLIRVTSFEPAVVEIDFCERIAPLAAWRAAGEWTEATPPPGASELGEKVRAIAEELVTPDPDATAVELRRLAAAYLARADELDRLKLERQVRGSRNARAAEERQRLAQTARADNQPAA
jgi:hypothetical protein